MQCNIIWYDIILQNHNVTQYDNATISRDKIKVLCYKTLC